MGKLKKKKYMRVETNFYCSMNYLLNCKGDMEWEAALSGKKVSRYWRNESIYSSQSSVIYLTLYYLNNLQCSHFKFGSIQRKRTRKKMCLYYMNLPALGSFHRPGKGRGDKLAQMMKYSLGKAGWRAALAGGKPNKVEQGTTTTNKKHPENGSESKAQIRD